MPKRAVVQQLCTRLRDASERTFRGERAVYSSEPNHVVANTIAFMMPHTGWTSWKPGRGSG